MTQRSGPGDTPRLRHVQQEYDGLASGYDRRWAGYVNDTTSLALAQLALVQLPLNPDARVLDLGCGTGVLLRRALSTQPTLQYIGVDVSLGMLQQAARQLPSNVALVQGTSAALPFPDGSIDIAVSTSALHYMPSLPSVLDELRRVLTPGGTVVLSDWCADYVTMRVLDRVLRVVDRAHERTISVAELTMLLVHAGFVVEQASRVKIDRFWGIMTVTARSALEPKSQPAPRMLTR